MLAVCINGFVRAAPTASTNFAGNSHFVNHDRRLATSSDKVSVHMNKLARRKKHDYVKYMQCQHKVDRPEIFPCGESAYRPIDRGHLRRSITVGSTQKKSQQRQKLVYFNVSRLRRLLSHLQMRRPPASVQLAGRGTSPAPLPVSLVAR